MVIISIMPNNPGKDEFERFYEKNKQAILNITHYYINDLSNSEDAFQDTFLYLYRSFATLQQMGEEQRKSYCYKAARNNAIRYNRKDEKARKTYRKVQEFTENSNMGSYLDSYTELVDDDFMVMLDGLSSRDKEIMCLRFVFGMKAKEIADELKISPNTVNQRVHQAKKKIRDRLKQRKKRKNRGVSKDKLYAARYDYFSGLNFGTPPELPKNLKYNRPLAIWKPVLAIIILLLFVAACVFAYRSYVIYQHNQYAEIRFDGIIEYAPGYEIQVGIELPDRFTCDDAPTVTEDTYLLMFHEHQDEPITLSIQFDESYLNFDTEHQHKIVGTAQGSRVIERSNDSGRESIYFWEKDGALIYLVGVMEYEEAEEIIKNISWEVNTGH